MTEQSTKHRHFCHFLPGNFDNYYLGNFVHDPVKKIPSRLHFTPFIFSRITLYSPVQSLNLMVTLPNNSNILQAFIRLIKERAHSYVV